MYNVLYPSCKESPWFILPQFSAHLCSGYFGLFLPQPFLSWKGAGRATTQKQMMDIYWGRKDSKCCEDISCSVTSCHLSVEGPWKNNLNSPGRTVLKKKKALTDRWWSVQHMRFKICNPGLMLWGWRDGLGQGKIWVLSFTIVKKFLGKSISVQCCSFKVLFQWAIEAQKVIHIGTGSKKQSEQSKWRTSPTRILARDNNFLVSILARTLCICKEREQARCLL